MAVRTTRSGEVKNHSVNVKLDNIDKGGWVVKSKKDIPNLEANVNDEVKAVAQYEEHKEQTEDPETAALLDHIQEEEIEHRKELKEAVESNRRHGKTLEVEKAPRLKTMGVQQHMDMEMPAGKTTATKLHPALKSK